MRPNKQCSMGKYDSAVANTPRSSSRSLLTPTGPTMLFSTGTKPPSTSPDSTASKTCSLRGNPTGSTSPNRARSAASLYAPRMPWNAIFTPPSLQSGVHSSSPAGSRMAFQGRKHRPGETSAESEDSELHRGNRGGRSANRGRDPVLTGPLRGERHLEHSLLHRLHRKLAAHAVRSPAQREGDVPRADRNARKGFPGAEPELHSFAHLEHRVPIEERRERNDLLEAGARRSRPARLDVVCRGQRRGRVHGRRFDIDQPDCAPRRPIDAAFPTLHCVSGKTTTRWSIKITLLMSESVKSPPTRMNWRKAEIADLTEL